MKGALFALLFFIFINSYSQKAISCIEIVKKIETNNKLLGTVSSLELLYDVPWLKEVRCYESENDVYVIADFYLDDIFYSTKKYVYCNIPKVNWESFSKQCCPLDLDGYGKKFHKYIADYKCDCE